MLLNDRVIFLDAMGEKKTDERMTSSCLWKRCSQVEGGPGAGRSRLLRGAEPVLMSGLGQSLAWGRPSSSVMTFTDTGWGCAL